MTRSEIIPATPIKEDALTVLRSETALSRFPLHRLTKGKNVQIELENQASAVLWRVDHNSRYGQPGALAYKIDSLFINRRIEESGRPVPKIIRLGSLREIAQEVGSGTNTTPVKQALLQNATASITAKISYRIQEGGEQWLEAVFSRYSVIFTGENLPNGGTADAVYLVLNDIYQQLLNNAVYRPLNFDYMKSLPPISQRFYEIVSYQIFGALKHRNPRAKVAYSEYCLLSTATRYFDFEHVKKQMYKVIRPHIQSGYLAKVEYEAITNERGESDWMLYLTPGPNADREFSAFTGQGKTRRPKSRSGSAHNLSRTENLCLPFPDADTDVGDVNAIKADVLAQRLCDESSTLPVPVANIIAADETKGLALVEALTRAELNRGDAERFVRERPDVCRRQLEYLPFVEKFTSSQGAYLRRAIENDFGPPTAYTQERKKKEEEQSRSHRRKQKQLEATEKQDSQRLQEARKDDFAAFLCQWVRELEETQPEAFAAFKRYEEEKRQVLMTGPLANRPMTRHALETFEYHSIQADRILDFWRSEGQEFQIKPPTFAEWEEKYLLKSNNS